MHRPQATGSSGCLATALGFKPCCGLSAKPAANLPSCERASGHLAWQISLIHQDICQELSKQFFFFSFFIQESDRAEVLIKHLMIEEVLTSFIVTGAVTPRHTLWGVPAELGSSRLTLGDMQMKYKIPLFQEMRVGVSLLSKTRGARHFLRVFMDLEAGLRQEVSEGLLDILETLIC